MEEKKKKNFLHTTHFPGARKGKRNAQSTPALVQNMRFAISLSFSCLTTIKLKDPAGATTGKYHLFRAGSAKATHPPHFLCSLSYVRIKRSRSFVAVYGCCTLRRASLSTRDIIGPAISAKTVIVPRAFPTTRTKSSIMGRTIPRDAD